ncbi:MAG: homocysteine S-methyltransferase family protein [Bacteroidota bacterium]
MNSLIQELVANAPVVIDGGWGTLLQARGLGTGECPDAWNVDRPETVRTVASLYAEAGSAVILTNTFRANRIALKGHGLDGKIREINRAGVELSRGAAGKKVKVFASIGPTGKMLMAGDVTEEHLAEVFHEQAELLAEAGADALVLETMSDLTEARIALTAARATGLPVVVSMVFDSGKERDRTMMGATPEQVAEELTAAGADVIGANCGVGIDSYVPVCVRLKAATDRPVWIKPNAGLPEMIGGNAVYTTTPEEFAQHGPALSKAGASFIGGCCGTTPDFVRALLKALGKTPTA